jgi:hypothetical protein
VPERHFTLDEANATLDELRPVAARMVELRARLRESAARRDELRQAIGGNGGGLGASDLAVADAEIEQLGNAVTGCLAHIQRAGVQVKDLDLGLLDFPSLRDGRTVLLCWHVGEDGIEYWHDVDEGFAGRRPVDAVE